MYLKCANPILSLAFAAAGFTVMITAQVATAQIQGGVANPSLPGKPGASATAVQAEFQSLLAMALSPDNVRAVADLSEKLAQQFPQGPYITDFDDVRAPCDFDETTPLLGRHQEAIFTGFEGNGGAILNQCSNFGVSALSQPNFLAFNQGVTYGNNATAKLPELIVVGPNRSTVSFWVSGGLRPGYPIGAIAIGEHAVKGLLFTTLTGGWVQLSLSTPGIQSVLLVGNPEWLVVDNIEEQ